MPIHSDLMRIEKANLIRAVGQRMGWDILIPDYESQAPIFDAGQTRKALSAVSLVIADLSRERPSCYFELGFAEALGKSVKIIAQKGTEIHQTGHRDQVRFYEGFHDLELLLTDVFSNADGN
jgi:hypothetical protein